MEQIILFGSQARGTADEYSDIDLLVILKNIHNRFELMRRLRRKLHSIPYDFDILTITPEEYNRDRQICGTLARYASQDGLVIYDSK
ncbi:MAG: nucleotidyltransferase domain-containing protein [Ignavibacteriaceae bacterium]|nr:nucleotidyltransferase domain-containing protein [Ignavibacteriaceae bacterium]